MTRVAYSKDTARLRFGVVLPTYPKGATIEGMVATAKAAERLGFSSVWTTDHIILPMDQAGPYESIFEPVLALAYVASQVENVQLGLSVLVVPQRNGIVLAKELATLDHLCGGKLIVGVGAGWSQEEFTTLGFGDRFKVRGTHLDETLEMWSHLWTEPQNTFEGRFYDIGPSAFGPPPLSTGGPPIWVGGSSAGARRRAGKYGAAWHPVGLSPETLRELCELTFDEAKQSCHPAPRIVPRLPIRIGVSDFSAPTTSKMHSVTGSLESVKAQFEEYVESGVDEIICLFGSPDSAEVIEQMEIIHSDISPHFS